MKYDFPTGMNKPEESGLSLYPNPVKTNLTIHFNNIAGQSKFFEVYDIQGKLMAASKTSEDIKNLNTEEYPSGIYIVKVRTEKSNYIARFIKIISR